MNNYIRISDLKCPSTELACALKKLFSQYENTNENNTTLNQVFDPLTGILTTTVNGVSVSTSILRLMSDLDIRIFSSNSSPSIGDEVTFTLRINNNGPDIEPQAIVDFLLPPSFAYISSTTTNGSYNPTTGKWTIPSLINNETINQIIKATYIGPYEPLISLNTSISGLNIDTNMSNNNNIAYITPTESSYSDLSIIIGANPPQTSVGQNITLTISLSNATNIPAQNAVVLLNIPDNLVYQSQVSGIGTYDPITKRIEIGVFPPNTFYLNTMSFNVANNNISPIVIQADISATNEQNIINNSSTTLLEII